MRWDFADDVVPVPVPGVEHRAYAHFAATVGGCRVEVNQLVDTPKQATFMQNAWRVVLGRLARGLPDIAEPDRFGEATGSRSPRAKHPRGAPGDGDGETGGPPGGGSSRYQTVGGVTRTVTTPEVG